MNLKCAGCGKAHQEVRLLVALTDTLHICNECVDLCLEICADKTYGGDGFVRIATKELESLRKQVHQAEMTKIWISSVRDAMDRADAVGGAA